MSMGLPNAAMTFGKGGRVTILLLLATVLQKGDMQITCNIEIDTQQGLWRETTPKQANEDQYCTGYRYRETTLQYTSTQRCPQTPNQQGSCTVYYNADTKWPCLATCNGGCKHEYKCQTNGVCPCSQNNTRYKKAKMCVRYSAVQKCQPNKYYDQKVCAALTCTDVCPNGLCDTSGHCNCENGFIQDSKTKMCVPVGCTQACVGGTCHTYGACSCQDGSVVGPQGGYSCPINTGLSERATHTNHQCTSATCVNGYCYLGGCKCNDGFKADTNKGVGCAPIDCPEQDPTRYCQRKCERSNCKNNGQCLNDGTCNCNLDYKKSQLFYYQCDQIKCPSMVSEDNIYCKKQCNGNCINGWCYDDGTCYCYEGFKKASHNSYQCYEIQCPSKTSDDAFFCKKQCDESCKNGECDVYGTCNCKEGFKKSPNNPYQCDKIQCPSVHKDDLQYCDAQCGQHCYYGKCSNGGNCTCNEGYMKDSDSLYQCNQINCPTGVAKYYNLSENKCIKSCYNGECVKDGTCNCRLGFKKSKQNYYQCDRIDCPSKTKEDNAYCKAKCDGYCKNGFCNESGACTCYNGFRKNTKQYYQCDQIQCPSKASEDNSYCKSYCDSNCKNGTCNYGGTCSCNEGYKKSLNTLYQCDQIICPSLVQEDNVYCETKCKKFCSNGICDNLGRFSCNTGYTKDSGRKYKCDKITCPSTISEEWGFCKAVCESQCDDGTCNEGGICNCTEGFKKLHGENYKCSKIKCPAFTIEENVYCKSQCINTCNNGKCNENGTCNCDDSFTYKNGTCEKICVTDHDCQAEKLHCSLLNYCVTNEEHKTECAETCSSGCDRICKKCSTSEDCPCENGAKDILTCTENCISSNCEIKEDDRKWVALACALIVALLSLQIGFGVWICRRRIINARHSVFVTVPEGVKMRAIQDHGRRQTPNNQNCETYLEPRRIGQETGKDGMEYPLYETLAEVFSDVPVEPREPSYIEMADLMDPNKVAPARFNVPKEQKEPTYENITGDVAGAPQETPVYVNVSKDQDVITYVNITGDKKAGNL